MPRVIVLDKIAAEGLQLLEESPGIEFEVRTGLKGDELREALRGYDGAICRSGVKITAESLEGNQRIKAIVRAGVGTDNIDKQAATRQGVVVMNTPTGNTLSTAEHAFALLLALSRNIAPAYQSLLEHRWDRGKYMGSQLAGKTLGVVGLGRIGQEVASRARAFQMRVLGFDPLLSSDQAAKMGVELYESVDSMLPEIDYLTVHTPLTPHTQNLIDRPQLERIKKGARLVNCARGGIYNEAALAEGLRNGQLGGVALDVFEQEPCTDSELFGMPGVLCTPHLGASTEEAQTQVAVEAVQLLVNYLTKQEIRHAVNMAPVDPKTLEELRGHLDLAYRLGLLLSQYYGGGIERCRLVYQGEVADKDTRLLTASFCAGLLENVLDHDVNVVNAEFLLRERGIELDVQQQTKTSDFASSITAEVQGDGEPHLAAGTLFGAKMPRLIRLGDYRLEAYLDGVLLIFTHTDVPGIIGTVGTIFGKHDVNIAQMAVGRAGVKRGGAAVGVLNLDEVPPDEAIEEVHSQDSVESVRVIELPGHGVMPSWLQG